MPIWKNTQKLVTVGASGYKNRRMGPGEGWKTEFPPCSSVLFGFFFSYVCVFQKNIKELIYSFNKQFWYVQWVLGTKKMRSSDSREALTDSHLWGGAGGCAAEPCNLSSRLRPLTEGVPQTEHQNSGVEVRPRQDNAHPQPAHRAGRKGRPQNLGKMTAEWGQPPGGVEGRT